MRKYLLAAVAAAAIATPALARDGQPYVGIEGGLLLVNDMDVDLTVDSGTTSTRYNNLYSVKFKNGFDGDVIAGYDFGLFRLEGELGYKRVRADELRSGQLPGSVANYDVSGRANILSLMGNAMADVTDSNGWSGYVGGGVGRARARFAGDTDSAFAWQLIAGVRKAVSDNIDVGVKYRFFNTGKLNFNDDFTNGTSSFDLNQSGKVRSHSLLASVIFNFGAPAPAPVIVEPVAPPPPPPATQTCFDGSVILATDVCPQPPVETPPPPPAPVPERG